MFFLILYAELSLFRYSFTLGEAILISQIISVFCVTSVISFGVGEISKPKSFLNLVLLELIALELVLSPILFKLRTCQPYSGENLFYSMLFYLCGALTIWLVIIPTFSSILDMNPFVWLLHFLLEDRKFYIFGYWITVLAISLVWIKAVTNNPTVSNTVVRKYFHVVSLLLFIPGVIYSPTLLSLSFGCALAILVMLETIRYGNIKPLDTRINQYMRSFIDDKDEGPLILTHIYLLIGCASPLWLYAGSTLTSIAPYAGLIIVGVGDALASVVGKSVGRTKWPRTSKTVEGTLAAIVGVIVFAALLLSIALNVKLSYMQLFAFIVATTLACLMEACTTQVDNLILPLYYLANLWLV